MLRLTAPRVRLRVAERREGIVDASAESGGWC
jgi:hypothetical protein